MSKIEKKNIQQGGGKAFKTLIGKVGSPFWRGIRTAPRTFRKIWQPIAEDATGYAEGLINEATDPFKNAIDDVETPFGKVMSTREENKSLEQVLAESYNSNENQTGPKAYVKPDGIKGTVEYWDLFYDEPCWIDPVTNSLDLSTAFSKLWCEWYMVKDPAVLMGDLTNTAKIEVDEGPLFQVLAEKFPDSATNFRDNMGMAEVFKDAIKKFTGEDDDQTARGDVEKLASNLNLPKDMVDPHVTIENNIVESLANPGDTFFQLVQGKIEPEGEAKSDGADCNYKKWWFCFFFKFLTGPVGLLMLKLLPYWYKFTYLILNTIERLYNTLSSGFRRGFLGIGYLWKTGGRPTPWIDKRGKPRVHMMFTTDIIYQYLGLVIPLGLFKYKWGIIYGNGEFGKFIFSLVLVSVGLIFMGGISIFVFLCVFIFYCAKTLSMFGDNVTEQKK